MVHYDAAVLKEIESHFFAIESNAETPDRYIQMPTKTFARCCAQEQYPA
jgi:hypothetical protein